MLGRIKKGAAILKASTLCIAVRSVQQRASGAHSARHVFAGRSSRFALTRSLGRRCKDARRKVVTTGRVAEDARIRLDRGKPRNEAPDVANVGQGVADVGRDVQILRGRVAASLGNMSADCLACCLQGGQTEFYIGN